MDSNVDVIRVGYQVESTATIPITFHWCDKPDRSSNTPALTSTLEYLPIYSSSSQPYKLSKNQEIIICSGKWDYYEAVILNNNF